MTMYDLPKVPPPGPPTCIVRTPSAAKPPRCAFSREEDWLAACEQWRRGIALYIGVWIVSLIAVFGFFYLIGVFT